MYSLILVFAGHMGLIVGFVVHWLISLCTEDVPAGLHSTISSKSDCRSRSRKFESPLGNVTFMEIDHEIISKVILTLSLIQEGLLSITGEDMCTSTGLTA